MRRMLLATSLFVACVSSASVPGPVEQHLRRCRVDASSCELAGTLAPPKQFETWCRKGDTAACVVEAIVRAQRLPLRKTKAAAVKVLDEACSGGFLAACSLRAKHTITEAELDAEPYTRDDKLPLGQPWRVVGPRGMEPLVAACTALEPLACELLAAPALPKALETSCAAGNPVSCFRVLTKSPAPAEGSLRPFEAVLALCREGAREACHALTLRSSGIVPLPDATATDLSRLLTRQCFDGNGWACHSALELPGRVVHEDKLCAAARDACGAGRCGMTERWPFATCAFPSEREIAVVAHEEESCLRRGWCINAAEKHLSGFAGVPPDKDEARLLLNVGCDRGLVESCRKARELGAKPQGWVPALVADCKDSSCPLSREVEADPETFRGRDEVRAALVASCRLRGTYSCTVAAKFAASGLWGTNDVALSLEMLAGACAWGEGAQCTALDSAVARNDAFSVIAAERACQTGRPKACEHPGVPPQPRVIHSVAYERGKEQLATIVGGHLVFRRGDGYRVLVPGASQATEDVPALSSTWTEFSRPFEKFKFGTRVDDPVYFMRDGVLGAVACGSRATGRETEATAGVAVWGAAATPVWQTQRMFVRNCDWAVRRDGKRAWVAIGHEYAKPQGIREVDLERGEFAGPERVLGEMFPVAVSDDGRTMLVLQGSDSGSRRNLVRVLDVASGAVRPEKGIYHSGHPVLALRGDGRRAVIGNWDAGVNVWSLDGEPTRLVSLGHVSAAAYSPDGTLVAVVTERGGRLVDAETGSWRSPLFPDAERPIVFSPDGRFVAFGGKTVQLVAIDPTATWPKPARWASRVTQLPEPVKPVRPELQRTWSLTFTVREKGAPAAGAVVEAVVHPDYRSDKDAQAVAARLKPWKAKADANGVVSVKGLAGAVYRVTITSRTGRLEVGMDATQKHEDVYFLR